MTVYLIGAIKRFVALEDERPDDMSGVPIGSRLLEADTGTELIYVGDYFAGGVLTMAAQAEVDDEITIGEDDYSFVAVEPAAGQIEIGGTIATTVANIIAAINGADGVNAPSATVTAAAGGEGEVVLTAIAPGASTLATVYTHDDGDENSFADATLTGGYDQWQALP